jgi:hypothetical protein
MSSVFHSGFLGTAALGSSELPIIKWDVVPTTKLEEFKNSKSGGYIIRESTFKDCSVTLDIDYDFSAGPFDSPYSISIGAIITNAKLFLHQSGPGNLDGSYWGFTSLIVDTTPQNLTVDGKIVTRVTAKGSGSFTYPT